MALRQLEMWWWKQMEKIVLIFAPVRYSPPAAHFQTVAAKQKGFWLSCGKNALEKVVWIRPGASFLGIWTESQKNLEAPGQVRGTYKSVPLLGTLTYSPFCGFHKTCLTKEQKVATFVVCTQLYLCTFLPTKNSIHILLPKKKKKLYPYTEQAKKQMSLDGQNR